MARFAVGLVLLGVLLVPSGCRRAERPAVEPDSTATAETTTTSKPPSEVAEPSDLASLAAVEWPLFRGGAAARGVAGGKLPSRPKLLWTFALERGGFEATAVVQGGVVYIGATDGDFRAIGLDDGKPRWTFPTEPGFTAPAAVREGRVYVGDVDGRFHSLDAADGKELWHFDTDGEISGGPNFDGDRVLVGSQDGNLYCLDATTGERVWTYESKDQIRCFPTIAEGHALVAGCDGQLHVVVLASAAKTRSVPLHSPTGSTAAVLGDRAFVGTEAGRFFAVDWRTGVVAWEYQPPDKIRSMRSSAAVATDALFVGTRDGRLHAIAIDSGKPLWEFRAGGQIDGSPVLVGPWVVVGSDDGSLYIVHRTSGKEIWRYDTGGAISASPAVAEGRLVVGTEDGDLLCFGD
ncbi:MAG: PQQ-binding-like beta-propeller repeat protein [Pirellulaceae bacterium]|nr:PQQ-binding-like beta-propeller repeat protein [Pirellulaceae bacterium]